MRAERVYRVEFSLDPMYPAERAAIEYLKACPNKAAYCRRSVMESIAGVKQKQIDELKDRLQWLEQLLASAIQEVEA